jgi:hypothetical protein
LPIPAKYGTLLFSPKAIEKGGQMEEREEEGSVVWEFNDRRREGGREEAHWMRKMGIKRICEMNEDSEM